MAGLTGQSTAYGAIPLLPHNASPLQGTPRQAIPAAFGSSILRTGSKRIRAVLASAQQGAVNAMTLETTETDLSAELKEVLSKVKPKVYLKP